MKASSINTLNEKQIVDIFIRLVRKNDWIFLFFCLSRGLAPLNN